MSVVNGELKEVCSAKVRTLGEKVGQAWRLHVHPQDSSKAAYVNRKGEVKWSLQEIEVPTVEQCVKEDALEVQDIRELGLGWAWFMNDLRAFLPAWQDMELASPSSEEPVTQIEADVPIEPIPLQADATHLDLDLQVYEHPLAVTPFGTPEVVPDWQENSCHVCFCRRPLSRQVDPYRSRCAYLSRALAKMVLQENKWFVVSLKTCTPALSWKTYPVILIFRRLCTVSVFLTVVLPRVVRGTYRLPLCIACFLALVDQLSFLPRCCLPVFLWGGGGGSASFSKIVDDTSVSVRSTLGTRTLSMMRQFIEDVEKGGEEESGSGGFRTRREGNECWKDTGSEQV